MTELRDVTGQGLSLGAAVPVRPDKRTEGAAFQGKPAAEMHAEHQAWLDEQPTSTSCFFCDWRFEGTAAECREAALAHREKEHPGAANRLGRRRAQSKPKYQRTEAENEQAAREAVEARRVRAEREDADRLAQIERGRKRDAPDGEPQDREEEPEAHSLVAESSEPQPADSPPPRDESDDEGTTMAETIAERLGLRKFGRGYIWTREAMLEAVREYAREHGEPPTQEDAKRAPLGMLPSTKSIRAEFSSWDALIVAAGYTPRAKASGREPSGGETGRPTPDGDGAALAQAEEPASHPEKDRGGRRPTWTREMALRHLHEQAVDGVAPARAAFIASGISNAVIARLFGTYTEMVGAAGLTAKLQARYLDPAPLTLAIPDASPREQLRDPLRTADIPYDAEILEDEASFLRQRADALEQIAAGVRALAAASRRDLDEHDDEELAA